MRFTVHRLTQRCASPRSNGLPARRSAQEYPSNPSHPTVYADQIQWLCCGEPGWGEAWDSGMEVRREAASEGIYDLLAIGADPSVIPDSWVLTAVQKHLGLLSEQSGT